MKIQILGTGCAKCKKLAETAETAARELGLDYELVKVTEISDILDFGIMATPGLAVDGKVLSAGKVPTVEQVKTLLSGLDK
ncbi:TM0996/MTH895 family glutaredoxin-like protein [Aminithiophilus ramosus]|uniref:TM0996/MTH895 family glutaredoxin-like protein n=2 Tax=Synergistales TaxID=649776 RepID=A0A9Q7A8C7_9BACT|nr:thioredoxin family protein [Aminithiophilus ramosus]QTX32476.1 TM0996/MTH895 family glutaredoxin-like protein [Aminithiophilus ramosus]QVL36353.1 TM0996/MTH895 family glutaredoxin-like protein [Synergistota bacterium]